MTQPFKVCPQCGQRLAVHMAQSGRCNALQSAASAVSPAPVHVTPSRTAKRPTNWMDIGVGFLLGAFVMMMSFAFIMISHPDKPTPDATPQTEGELNLSDAKDVTSDADKVKPSSEQESQGIDEVPPQVIGGGERAQATADSVWVEMRNERLSSGGVPSAGGSTYVRGHYRTNASGSTSYVRGHSRR